MVGRGDLDRRHDHAVPNVQRDRLGLRIDDGHIPARGANAGKQRLAVVSAVDYNRYAETLGHPVTQIPGPVAVSSASNRKLVIDPAVPAGTPAGSAQDGLEVSFRVRWQAVAKAREDELAARVLHRGEKFRWVPA
jgi:hypothetical protein